MKNRKEYQKKYDELWERSNSTSTSTEYWESLVKDIEDFLSDPGIPKDLSEITAFGMEESAVMTLKAVEIINTKKKNGGNNGKR